MVKKFRVACLQFSPTYDLQDNSDLANTMTLEAIASGSSLVLLPEYAGVLHGGGQFMKSAARVEQSQPMLRQLCATAKDAGVWILIGSLTIPLTNGLIANRSFLISDQGEIHARYDKIHMFDATLPNGRVIRESSLYEAGNKAVLARIPWGLLGMSICYDLRFPNLYRCLANAGAIFMAVPSAFTKSTGKMHWHTLLRARAIENGCYIFAPATCGNHPGNHETFGHSLIIDPWGKILVDGGDEVGIYYAEIDPEEALKVRSMLPSLENSSNFELISYGN